MKDFDTWNKIKKSTSQEKERFYTVREVWWCQLGINIGAEQDGAGKRFLRPVIIVRGFGPSACLVIPLTTSKRNHSLRIFVGSIGGKDARANVSQIRVVDTRRLVEKIQFLNKDIFVELKKAVRDLL